MRHFIAYHNAKKMGYSCTDISEPQVKTGNVIVGLEGVTVWLIAGEGGSPKSYYLTAHFVATKCEPNSLASTRHPHRISGSGRLLGLSKPLSGTTLLLSVRAESANFVRGFYETKDLTVVSQLKALL